MTKQCRFNMTTFTNKEEILDAIYEVTGITYLDMRGNSRKRHLVDARTIFARKMKDCSTLTEISRQMQKNHATVKYYFDRYEEQMRYKDFRELVKKIEERMKG